MDSYRVEKRATMRIALADENAEIGPAPTSGGGRRPEPELDRLSSILQTFNEQFGDIDW
jgi:type I restriction enzyme R subunit